MFVCVVDDVLGDISAASVPNVDRFEEPKCLLFVITKNGDRQTITCVGHWKFFMTYNQQSDYSRTLYGKVALMLRV